MKSEKLLELIKRVQAIAQSGLTYTENKYDIDRYQQLREISVDLMQLLSDEEIEKIKNLFTFEKGYQTPKVDVRGVVFRDNEILMVKESVDGRWSIPGGWADIGFSPFEIAVKEVQEEAGLVVEPVRLLAVLDKRKSKHPPDIYHVYKIFILCRERSGDTKPGMETLDVDWFKEDDLPPLSGLRNTKEQIELMFEYNRDPGKDSVCD